MIHPARIRVLNEWPPVDGQYVLYWMQASQRTVFNQALEYAIERANAIDRPVIVVFGLTGDYPEANLRHYMFMLEGLRDVRVNLAKRGILLVIKRNRPPSAALSLAKSACLVVCDRGYLRHQRTWRDEVADAATCGVVEIESDIVVPVETASEKQELAARTLRPKIHRQLDYFLAPFRRLKLRRPSLDLRIASDVDISSPRDAAAALKIDQTIAPVGVCKGGQEEARRRVDAFIKRHLSGYAAHRGEPAEPHSSGISAYLHFGQVSPVELALRVRDCGLGVQEDRDAFLEQLIIRRELAMNFVTYCPHYDAYDGLPAWARRTLELHNSDRRPHIYTAAQLESASTHDHYWNAAQKQMVLTGCMPNYMRMYWGKKILEWSPSPCEAYRTALCMNNKYFLDGRDPVSYASVGWLFGLHDRPWTPRPVFGTIRYMNAAGLDRKFDMQAYVKLVNRLA